MEFWSLWADYISSLALHQSPRYPGTVAEPGRVMHRLLRKKTSRGEKQFQFLDPSPHPLLKSWGPSQISQAATCLWGCPEPTSPQLHLGGFLSFFGKSASPPHPSATGHVGVSRKRIPKKGRDSQKGVPSWSDPERQWSAPGAGCAHRSPPQQRSPSRKGFSKQNQSGTVAITLPVCHNPRYTTYLSQTQPCTAEITFPLTTLQSSLEGVPPSWEVTCKGHHIPNLSPRTTLCPTFSFPDFPNPPSKSGAEILQQCITRLVSSTPQIFTRSGTPKPHARQCREVPKMGKKMSQSSKGKNVTI